MPEAGRIFRALEKLELFVVSENMLSNDTVAAGAHILLPAAAWGEKEGTVSNSERCISRQRAFLPLPGEVKPDWWIISEVARRMGFADAFPYSSAADVFREHAALSSFENAGARAFDIGGFASISDRNYSELVPVQWPFPADGVRKARLFSQGGYFTPSGKASFVVVEIPALTAPVSSEFPLRLNTGRVRDQWHTMTRTGKSDRLAGHRPEPFVEVHPRDATRYRLKHDGFARVTTRSGTCIVKVVVDSGQQPGSLFVPIHWNASNSAFGRIGDLVAACYDPVSGQPELKATPAAVMPVEFKYGIIALAREPIDFPASTLWVRFPGGPGIGYLGASNDDPSRWREYMPSLFGQHAVLAEYVDRAQGIYRAAAFVEGKLHGCLFLSTAESTPCSVAAGNGAPLPWRSDFDMENVPALSNMPIVCACFDVSLAAIGDALKSSGITDAEAIGRTLRAGTKCGTCLPELRTIVSAQNELRLS
jgi:assimilatory nitrate reductase catalytic subunit